MSATDLQLNGDYRVIELLLSGDYHVIELMQKFTHCNLDIM